MAKNTYSFLHRIRNLLCTTDYLELLRDLVQDNLDAPVASGPEALSYIEPVEKYHCSVGANCREDEKQDEDKVSPRHGLQGQREWRKCTDGSCIQYRQPVEVIR